jgi:hypothetical protein
MRSWSLIACISFLLVAGPIRADAQQYFKNPEDATAALAASAKADDANGVITVLGPEGRAIASSGDKVADKNARAKFLAAYDVKRKLTQEGDNKVILVIGSDDWPFPIPLLRDDKGWHFDARAGLREILFRRIGGNERNTIQACLAYVDAQNDYASMDPQKSGVPEYAQRIVSHSGKKDGLYWPATPDEPASPLGELAAAAAREGYRPGQTPAPFFGYHYKVLQGQGSAAPGGAYDYTVRGRMIGGFALVAYPAEYRNSGVMTFLVNHDGIVFQKDLGPGSARIASAMTKFNPDKGWTKVVTETSASGPNK